jgi:hypothetical protein
MGLRLRESHVRQSGCVWHTSHWEVEPSALVFGATKPQSGIRTSRFEVRYKVHALQPPVSGMNICHFPDCFADVTERLSMPCSWHAHAVQEAVFISMNSIN